MPTRVLGLTLGPILSRIKRRVPRPSPSPNCQPALVAVGAIGGPAAGDDESFPAPPALSPVPDVPPVTSHGLSRRIRNSRAAEDERPLIARGLGGTEVRSQGRTELFKFLSGYQQGTSGAAHAGPFEGEESR